MASMAMQMTKKMMREQYALQGINSAGGAAFDPMKMRAASDQSMLMLRPEEGVTFTALKLGILDAEECVSANRKDGAVILYIHGGGLVAGDAKTSRYYASILANTSGYPVYTCSYRLAPEHTYPAAQEDCLSGYEALLEKHPETPIVLVGESGGGYLSVTTALIARDKGLHLPAAVAVYSAPLAWDGSVDRSRNRDTDVSLTEEALGQIGVLYCPDEALRGSSAVSPLHADFTGFPPLLLAWDAGELLAADCEALRDKAAAVGVEVRSKGYDDAFHAFPTMGHMLPESEEVLQDTIAFIKAHI